MEAGGGEVELLGCSSALLSGDELHSDPRVWVKALCEGSHQHKTGL